MVCPVCIVAPMALGGTYISIFKNKYLWIGVGVMILSVIIYYMNKDCKKCKKK